MIDPNDETVEQSSHVGPIIFGHPTARNQLLDTGVVYTFRTSRRTVGETWARASRTGEKIADVTVEYACGIPAPQQKDLNDEWGRLSGFGSVTAWWDAINEVYSDPQEGHIYRVTERDTDNE